MTHLFAQLLMKVEVPLILILSLSLLTMSGVVISCLGIFNLIVDVITKYRGQRYE
jgi:hypothetical protein